jgi:hypothetical protein
LNARFEHVEVVGVTDAGDVPAVGPMKRVATSSLNASSVWPSIVILLLS